MDGWSGVVALPDGTVCDPDTPLLPVTDLGVARGDGVFETLLVHRGNPVGFGAHLARMGRSAALLELPLPAEPTWRRTLDKALAHVPAGLTQLSARLVATRGVPGGPPTAFVQLAPIASAVLAQRRDGVTATLLDRGLDPASGHDESPWLLGSAKTLSYAVAMAALRHAARLGHDEAIFTTPRGRLLEAPTASLVVLGPGRRMRTPPTDGSILPGTTQSALFDAAARDGWDVGTAELTVADLHAADAAWLVSSVRLAATIRAVDAHPLRTDVPAALALDLLDLH